jgi:Asp-tRNA(Asn)/Glu-tRNA(Gln) amidotransferase A subunit family amidase
VTEWDGVEPGRLGAVRACADAVRSGSVSAVALVERALDRIDRLDGDLGAVVALRAMEALAEAADADRTGAGAWPLYGVPVLIKDLEDVAGLPTRKGSLLLADAPAATDDGLVTSRLREAGAIVLGKTALPEFAIEGYTANLLTGITRNPWQHELSPGGSSGGSAAAMSAGMIPFATATDGGGSVRIPASCCGLVGLKPTNGVIGRWPTPDWIDLSTDGVFTTTVDDLELLLGVVRGPVAGDPTALPAGSDSRSRPVSRLYAAERISDLGPLPSDVRFALQAATEQLSALLASSPMWLDPASVFPGGDPDDDWFTITAPEHISALGRDRVVSGLDRMHPSSAGFFSAGLKVSFDEYLAARRRRFGYVRDMDLLLDGGAVLVTPTLACDGFLADGRIAADSPVGPLPSEVFSTAIQNLTGHPSISLPAGTLPNGLPFGVQVTAERFADAQLLDIARRWEAAHPWPLTAPGYEPFDSGFGRS